jgi:hypothetical protein
MLSWRDWLKITTPSLPGSVKTLTGMAGTAVLFYVRKHMWPPVLEGHKRKLGCGASMASNWAVVKLL